MRDIDKAEDSDDLQKAFTQTEPLQIIKKKVVKQTTVKPETPQVKRGG